MSDEKPVALPTFSGEKNRTEARQMSAAIGDVTGYRTRIQSNGDGSTTTLRTKGGMPRLTTTRSSEDVDEVSEKIVTVRPLSDYYPLGFEFDAESQALVSANYTWPRKTWPFYASLLAPNEGGGAVKVKKLAARKLHPGSTTWEDTRPNREHKSVLSWEAPFGGRNVANGKNYGRDSVGFYQVKHPGWDIYNVPLALDPEPPSNYEVYVDWPSPGLPLTFMPTCMDFVSAGLYGNPSGYFDPDGWHGQYGSVGNIEHCSMLPLLGYDAPTSSATWLYEDGKRLFKVEGLLTASKVGVHYRCITAALSTKRFADKSVTNFRVIDCTETGKVVREVPISFPRAIFWVWQVPFINSSGTKAAGIFQCESNNGNVHPTSCYEIDLVTGQVTEPLTFTAATTYRNPGNTTNYAASYSGVVACDYRGDTLVEVRMSGSVIVGDSSISIPMTCAFPEFSTSSSGDSASVTPLYVDLRHGIYVTSESVGIMTKSSAINVYVGGTIAKTHPTRTQTRVNQDAFSPHTYPADRDIAYFTAFSRKNEILYSFMGNMSFLSPGRGLPYQDIEVKFGSFLTTNKRTVEVKLDNKFNYPGELKWFSEPYMGPYVRNDPKKDEE